jgi:hypothetical protein
MWKRQMNDVFDDALFHEKVLRLSGSAVREIQFPAGKNRSTIRVILENGRAVYATRRKQKARATRELQILWALRRANVAAPNVIGVEDSFFLQQDVGGERLTLSLNAITDIEERYALVQSAVDSLMAVDAALNTDDLSPLFDANPDGLRARAKLPLEATRYFNMPPVAIDEDEVLSVLSARQDHPIKGDARAANAIRQQDGTIIWLDWDRVDRGSAVDDVVTLLCDEYLDLPFEMLEKLLLQAADETLGHQPSSQRENYVATCAVLQCLHRLSLIFSTYSDMQGWARYETCLKYDRVGASKRCVKRLCARGALWAQNSSTVSPAKAIFDTILNS